MIIPNIWENKIDVPNHQPEYVQLASKPLKRSPTQTLDLLVMVNFRLSPYKGGASYQWHNRHDPPLNYPSTINSGYINYESDKPT